MKLTIDLSGASLADDIVFIRDAYHSLTLLAAEAGNASGASSALDVANVLSILDQVQAAAFAACLDRPAPPRAS